MKKKKGRPKTRIVSLVVMIWFVLTDREGVFMHVTCSVPPPPVLSPSSETLTIVHGSDAFQWKSTTLSLNKNYNTVTPTIFLWKRKIFCIPRSSGNMAMGISSGEFIYLCPACLKNKPAGAFGACFLSIWKRYIWLQIQKVPQTGIIMLRTCTNRYFHCIRETIKNNSQIHTFSWFHRFKIPSSAELPKMEALSGDHWKFVTHGS